MSVEEIVYTIGFPDSLRGEAALLYDQAFGAKFAVAVRNRQKRLALLENSFCAEFSISAQAGGQLVGLAGFHTPEGSLTGGITLRQLLSQLNPVAGCWAACILSLYERKPVAEELLMDGIAVRDDMRGRGIGSRLLEQLSDYARERGYGRIRLDVIDTNPDAQRLYERRGFTAVRHEHFPYLRWLLGFGGATTMEQRIDPSDPPNRLSARRSPG